MTNILKRTAALVIALAMVITSASLMTAKVYAAEMQSVMVVGTVDYKKGFEVLTLINKERSKRGLAPLEMDKDLLEAAAKRGAECSLFFDHRRPNGEMCYTIESKMNGENIAVGQPTAQDVVTGWMNSSGHRANILNADYKSIGIVCYYQTNERKQMVWVQCFSRSAATQVVGTAPANGKKLVEIPIEDDFDTVITAPSTVVLTKGEEYYNFSSRATNYIWPYITLKFENMGLDFTPVNSSIVAPYRVLSDSKIGLYKAGIIGKSPGTTKVGIGPHNGAALKTITVTVINATRTFGSTRYETSLKLADRYGEASGQSKYENIVVACGSNYPDALSGGYLAAKKNAPMLLASNKDDTALINYISSHIGSGKVYLLGGTGAVSASFEKALVSKGCNVKRLGGATRFDTNLLILKEAGIRSNEDLIVSTAYNYADSLSASSLGKPMLLVGDSLTAGQKDFLESMNSTGKCYVIGGTGVVGDSVAAEAANLYNGGSKERIFGKSRYETSSMIAKKFYPSRSKAVIVYGKNFPDGLSAGPVAYKMNAPIVLASSNDTSFANSYVKSAGVSELIVYAGPSLISTAALKAILG